MKSGRFVLGFDFDSVLRVLGGCTHTAKRCGPKPWVAAFGYPEDQRIDDVPTATRLRRGAIVIVRA